MDTTTTTRDLLPEGLEDRLPHAANVAARVTRGVLDVLDAHGYDRVLTPTVEFESALASRMAGIEPRRMFRFVDPGSLRTLAVRSDITPQVGRLATTRLAGAPRPLRLAYAGQVLTIKGAEGTGGLDPTRERTQLGAELIGSDSVEAAAEVVSIAIAALTAVGATGISVDFTLPDLVDTLAAWPLPLAADKIAGVRRELDGKDAGALVAAGGEAYLPLLYATGPFETAIARLAALAVRGALDDRIAALRRIADRIGGAARLTLDPTERHGFEYQSWFGFMIYAEGVRGALARGGTYAIIGQDERAGEPATGFSLYPDPLIDALARGPGGARPALFLPLGHDAAVAARLRGEGWRTIAALAEGDDAAALGCSHRLVGGVAQPL